MVDKHASEVRRAGLRRILAFQGEAGSTAFEATRHPRFGEYKQSISRTNDQMVEQLRNGVADNALLAIESEKAGQITDNLRLLADSGQSICGDFYVNHKYALLVSPQLAEARKIPPLAIRKYVQKEFFGDDLEAPLPPDEQTRLRNFLMKESLRKYKLTYADVRRWPHAIKGLASEIEEIHTDDLGARQCDRFIRRHFPDATVLRASCTGRAAQIVKQHAEGKEAHEIPRQAAIASADAEVIYGLSILDVDTDARDLLPGADPGKDDKWTRYAVIGNTPLLYTDLKNEVEEAKQDWRNHDEKDMPHWGGEVVRFLYEISHPRNGRVAKLERELLWNALPSPQRDLAIAVADCIRARNLLDDAPEDLDDIIERIERSCRRSTTMTDPKVPIRRVLTHEARERLMEDLEDPRLPGLHSEIQKRWVYDQMPALIDLVQAAEMTNLSSLGLRHWTLVGWLRALRRELEQQDVPVLVQINEADTASAPHLRELLREASRAKGQSIRVWFDLNRLLRRLMLVPPVFTVAVNGRRRGWWTRLRDMFPGGEIRQRVRDDQTRRFRSAVAQFRRRRRMTGEEQMVHTVLKVTAKTADKATLDLLAPFARANVHICIEHSLPNAEGFGERSMLLEIVGYPMAFVREKTKDADEEIAKIIKPGFWRRMWHTVYPRTRDTDNPLDVRNVQNLLLDYALKDLTQIADVDLIGSFVTRTSELASSSPPLQIYDWEQDSPAREFLDRGDGGNGGWPGGGRAKDNRHGDDGPAPRRREDDDRDLDRITTRY